DPVVQEQATRLRESRRLVKVGGEPRPAHMLEHSHAHDLVELGATRELAIVAHLDATVFLEPLGANARVGEFGLALAERDAEGVHSVARGGKANEAAPAAPD